MSNPHAYNPPINPSLSESFTNVTDSASKGPHLPTTEDIAIAKTIINRETDILNAKIQGAMDMASATNSGRKKTPSGAVYGVAAKAKAMISNAVSEFNTNVEFAKSVLQRGLEA